MKAERKITWHICTDIKKKTATQINNFQKGTDPCFSNQIPMISTEITEFKNKGNPTVALETDNNILEKISLAKVRKGYTEEKGHLSYKFTLFLQVSARESNRFSQGRKVNVLIDHSLRRAESRTVGWVLLRALIRNPTYPIRVPGSNSGYLTSNPAS